MPGDRYLELFSTGHFRAGEMAHWLKCLPHKSEELGLDPQNLYKSQAW